MKKLLPYAALILGLIYLGSTFARRAPASDFDLDGLARLPVVTGGRIKPLDTVARTSLLVIQGRQRVKTADKETIPPAAWLLDVFARPEVADTHPTFRIDNVELRTMLGITEDDAAIRYDQPWKRTLASLGLLPGHTSRFPLALFEEKLGELERQGQQAGQVEAQLRTTYQRAVFNLYQHVLLYVQLKHTLAPPDTEGNFARELAVLEQTIESPASWLPRPTRRASPTTSRRCRSSPARCGASKTSAASPSCSSSRRPTPPRPTKAGSRWATPSSPASPRAACLTPRTRMRRSWTPGARRTPRASTAPSPASPARRPNSRPRARAGPPPRCASTPRSPS